MTNVQQALKEQLSSLQHLLLRLSDNAYCHGSAFLSGGSIGQHSRHIIELVQCLVSGYQHGMINYDNRKRDQQVETNRHHAVAAIEALCNAINLPDKPLQTEACFMAGSELSVANSSFNRELIYNIEHAIHHMALIKVALNELQLPVENDSFGVAYATVEYRKLCAQ